MTVFRSIGWFVATILIVSTINIVATSDKLTELQRARAEIFKLKSQLLQCQVSVGNSELSKEQSILIEEFRKELGGGNEEIFDWNTLTFSHSTKP